MVVSSKFLQEERWATYSRQANEIGVMLHLVIQVRVLGPIKKWCQGNEYRQACHCLEANPIQPSGMLELLLFGIIVLVVSKLGCSIARGPLSRWKSWSHYCGSYIFGGNVRSTTASFRLCRNNLMNGLGWEKRGYNCKSGNSVWSLDAVSAGCCRDLIRHGFAIVVLVCAKSLLRLSIINGRGSVRNSGRLLLPITNNKIQFLNFQSWHNLLTMRNVYIYIMFY